MKISLRHFWPLLAMITACTAPPKTLRRPAEFEPTAAVWLLWSNYDHSAGVSNAQATFDIIEALLPYTKVKLVVPSDSILQIVQARFKENNIPKDQLTMYQFPYREFWARDMGPSFVIDEKGQLAVTDFNFSAWGYAPKGDSLAALDEKLDERIAAVLKAPLRSSDIYTEGGDHEINGLGTIILTESVEMTRNPTMSLAQIEAEFKRMLGVSHFIWLKNGLREDDHTFTGPMKDAQGQSIYTVLTTNGHTDEYVRFVSPTTLLLAEADANSTDPIEQENARRLEASYQILKQAKDQDGKPFTIIRIPLPYPIVKTMQPGDAVYDMISTFDYTDGSIFPKGKPVQVMAASSYLNFTIANGCVIMPKYWKEGADISIKQRDEAAMAILQKAFPDKKIIPLDVLAVNLGGGGIHCITMNEPAVY
jgi:agmatine deiminase